MFTLMLFAAIYWMLLSSAWLPTLVAAAIGGIIAALVTGDPWLLATILVAGTLSGWFATLVCFVTMVCFDILRLLAHDGRPGTSKVGLSDLADWTVGPVVAIVVALVVVLTW
jgi:hypothetical protein